MCSYCVAKSTCTYLCVSQCVRLSHKPSALPLGLVPSTQLQQANYSRQSLLSPHAFFFFFYPEAPLCPCPLPPTLLRPRLATARHNELSCRWEPGGSRREGIQELLIDSVLAFMEIVVKLQFVALMIFRWSRLESTHFTNCLDFFFFLMQTYMTLLTNDCFYLTTVCSNLWINFLIFQAIGIKPGLYL